MIVIPKDWAEHPDEKVRAFVYMAAWMLNEKENEDIRQTPGGGR
jgi:hypothetical protein